MIERILIAADGSPSGQEAIEFGLGIAEKRHARVTFFYAIRPVVLSEWSADFNQGEVRSFPFEPDAVEQAMLDDATRLADARGIDSNVEIAAGDPVAQIISHADSIDADLIVVGSRGQHEVAGSLLGSVSSGVLHKAPRPVLVVRHHL
jgi:nucleotide-binding universal stress UspA family protein